MIAGNETAIPRRPEYLLEDVHDLLVALEEPLVEFLLLLIPVATGVSEQVEMSPNDEDRGGVPIGVASVRLYRLEPELQEPLMY